MFAAVTLSVLCGCNSDEPENMTDSANGTLNILVEDLHNDGQTRSAYNPSGNKISWQKGDMLNVYDNELMTYDEYTFSSAKKAFVTDAEKSNIEGTISYALFPMQQVDYAGWTSKGNRAVINLPTTIVYDDTTEDAASISGTTLYASRLPMWGTATGTFGSVTVNLKYLTAVMKLKVNKSKATFVKIYSAVKPLSGGFEAVIAKDGQTETEPILKQGGKSLGTQKYVIIDLRKMPSSEGYVYLPIISDTYDDLTVATTTLSVAEGESLTKAQITDKDEVVWKTLMKYSSGKKMNRGTAYLVTL